MVTRHYRLDQCNEYSEAWCEVEKTFAREEDALVYAILESIDDNGWVPEEIPPQKYCDWRIDYKLIIKSIFGEDTEKTEKQISAKVPSLSIAELREVYKTANEVIQNKKDLCGLDYNETNLYEVTPQIVE